MNQETLDYLAGRGLDAEVVKASRIGLVSTPMDGHEYLKGRLAIPYLGPKGNVYNLRFRCLAHEDCKAEGCDAKYISLPGYAARVFNVRAIKGGHTELHVTEGELDCITLSACGLASVGLPGVENMPRHFPRLVAGFSRVYLWADGDAAGRGLVRDFTKAVPWGEAVFMKDGDDVNSLYVRGGQEAIEAQLRRVQGAH
jgi:DNA primase